MTGSMSRYMVLLGLAAAVTPWLFILAAAIASGCFSLGEHALSDLGDWETACGGDPVCLDACNRLSEPIFNIGLVISGVLITLYSLLLLRRARLYPSLLMVAGISLSIVGLCPERCRPYHFLSALVFFITAPAAALASGFSPVGLPRKYSLPLATASYIGFAILVAQETGVETGFGLAVPEIMVALPASIWLALLALSGAKEAS